MQIFQNIRANDAATEPAGIQVNSTSSSTKPETGTVEPALPRAQSTDTTAISSTATLLALALSDSSPQSSRVTEITSSLSSGSLKVDSAVLATSVMDSMLNYAH